MHFVHGAFLTETIRTVALNSFDAKNSKWYLIAMAALLIGELAVVVSVLMGDPPKFSVDHARTLIAYATASACSVAFMLALGRGRLRPIYWLCFALIAFSAAGFAAGYSPKSCLLTAVAAAVVMVASFISGDKGDVNSPKRTIRIKLPWG